MSFQRTVLYFAFLIGNLLVSPDALATWEQGPLKPLSLTTAIEEPIASLLGDNPSPTGWGQEISYPKPADLRSPNSVSRNEKRELHLAQQSTPTAAQTNLQAVLGVSITVSDMDTALAFYTQVLPFQKISDVEVAGTDYERLQGVFGLRMRVVHLRLGRETIELIDYLTPGGRPIPVDSRSHDLWFQHIAIVVRDMDAAYQHLRQHNVQHASTGPQTLPEYIPAAAGIKAFYFRDPDGHNLEVIYFPPGKGDPRWQTPTEELFLGIDHTAIAISNTQNSRTFYENLLGLQLAGQSENYGTEQEHLNNVFGARLLISGLKAPTGPGVEFLHYLAPATGRPTPVDSKADDLWHWATILQVQDLAQTAKRLREGGATLISPGVITLPTDHLGFRKGLLVKDPDGHVLRLVEP